MWYTVDHIEAIDSPALLVFPERVARNIETAKIMAGDVQRLRVHVKTCKISDVCRIMLNAGITRYKCATVAEAEMLGQVGAPDVLLAYQLVGPKVQRFFNLTEAYRDTRYSCLVDNLTSATEISRCFAEDNRCADVFLDLDVGMNRTGVTPSEAACLMGELSQLKGIRQVGVHVYDGHIHDRDMEVRMRKTHEAFAPVKQVVHDMEHLTGETPVVVAGGSVTFPVHLKRDGVECSPGTFVFWDWGYSQMLREQRFDYAALLLVRVISVIDRNTVCVDLGYKSVAAENPLPRVHFLNATDAVPLAQSEEHLTLRVPDSRRYPPGTVMYGVPVHICPTVALYEKVYVIEDHHCTSTWKVTARDRTINC